MVEVYSIYPQTHRTGITEVDAANPSDPSGAIDAKHYQKCRFDITLSGEGFTSLEVQPIFWSEETEGWIETTEKKVFTAVGDYALMVDSGSGVLKLGMLFLKVTAFVGTSFSFSADFMLS